MKFSQYNFLVLNKIKPLHLVLKSPQKKSHKINLVLKFSLKKSPKEAFSKSNIAHCFEAALYQPPNKPVLSFSSLLRDSYLNVILVFLCSHSSVNKKYVSANARLQNVSPII